MRRKENKGITLVALAITIIILLILAGISITGLTKDNGLIKEAKTGKELAEVSGLEEQIDLAIIKAKRRHRNSIIDDVIEELKNSKVISNENQVDKEMGTIKTDAGYEIEGKLDDFVAISAKDIANSENKGKYYGAEVTGYECENGEAVNCWRLYYADQNNVYLIADEAIDIEYIPNTKGGSSVINNNGKTIALNFATNGYEGSKDIEENSLAKKWLSEFLAKHPNGNKNVNARAVAYLMDTNAWNVFAGNNAEFAIAGPTIELFCASYQDTHPNKYIVYKNTNNGYIAKWSNASDESYGYIYDIPKNDFNKIYNKDGEIYWLASPWDGNSLVARVAQHSDEIGGIDSYYVSDTIAGALRPVVCLKRNVKLKKVEEGIYKIK